MQEEHHEVDIRPLIRNFAIEMVLYGVLVTIYYLIVLRLLSEPLDRLFENNMPVYAISALLLIVAQSVLLERVTTFLLDRLGLQRLE
jgi:hypothetical protein